MSPHALCQVHPVVKSESPPILSVSISSIQPHPPYPDSGFRFGTGEHNALPPFSFMSQPRSSTWPQHTTISHLNPYSTSAPGSQSHFGLPPMDDANALTLTDECDDGDELGDLPSASGSAADMFPDSLGSSSKAYDKAVRRRSSKACDQCRKSKCKCERTSDNESCKACIMLGTHCTFLGPSRKRGPPKGYIDAIEARLHQTEALVGIMLAVDDSRARSLLEDLSQDPLAYEIIRRVDNSPYGVKGRARAAEASSVSSKARPHPAGVKTKSDPPNSSFHTTHPSIEWQERVIAMVRRRNSRSPSRISPQPSNSGRPVLSLSIGRQPSPDSSEPPRARQRRITSRSPSDSFHSLRSSPAGAGTGNGSAILESDPMDELEKSRGAHADALVSEVGQLSLNEEREVRFHGQASGLHLLDLKERIDGRNEGGIWHFPKARVWPPLPPDSEYGPRRRSVEEVHVKLPDAAIQEELLEIYFAYVHPALPVLHKQSFLEELRNGHVAHGCSNGFEESPSPLKFGRSRAHISPLLLLTMFSVAARHTSTHNSDRPPSESTMWPAGDAYLEEAKRLLDSSYASSRSATCQALLLMGYREIGIGAMAQAWLYVGMAVRMAQDLGMHKNADQWTHEGTSLFTSVELQARRRIWYSCVIMDKYVSSYMGRPLSISEREFDTELPSIDESEETEEWQPAKRDREGYNYPPFRIHTLSCFNASARLSIILSEVVQCIYAVRSGAGRHSESIRLGALLDKWLLELPEHLRFDPSNWKKPHPPSPFILTLHMQYWCVVLLLHRPFMSYAYEIRTQGRLDDSSDPELRVLSQKNYDLSVQAANRITSIILTFKERHSVRRAPMFLTYYVFTASIMHARALNAYPDDPQARKGLATCMDVLQRMSIAWPGAGRAWELLYGSKANLKNAVSPLSTTDVVRTHKRSADHFLDDDVSLYRVELHPTTQGDRPEVLHGQPPPEPESSLGNSQNFYPLCDRWPGEGGLNDFAGNLSTSALPQQYSTGFFDRRGVVRGSNASSAAEVDIGPHQESPPVGRRGYSRYWNDYSTLGQLGAPFTNPIAHEGPQHQQHHSQGYPISGQYSLYDNLPPSHI